LRLAGGSGDPTPPRTRDPCSFRSRCLDSIGLSRLLDTLGMSAPTERLGATDRQRWSPPASAGARRIYLIRRTGAPP
jgi:hypothetical protein